MKKKINDKELFAGTGRRLTKAEQKRKWELLEKPSNEIYHGINYTPNDPPIREVKDTSSAEYYKQYE